MNLRADEREDVGSEAVAWLSRVHAPEATEADWLALEAWLAASPAHLAAYDSAERVSAELDALAPELRRALAAPIATQPAPRRAPPRRHASSARRIWRPLAGIAAAAAAAVLFVAVRPEAPVPTEVFQTQKGESRLLDLADGSHIHLNSGSRLTVRLEKTARRLELAEGEAAFDVAHDPNRPFLIAAGERTIRVVGTEFDVLRHDGRLRVTVRRGVVSVQSPEDAPQGEPILLRAGDQLDHRTGERAWVVQKVDAEAAFAWKRGDLVYRDQPLGEVVGDLNRYFETPVRAVGPAADLRFSGVLKIENEAAVVRRLQAFLPVTARQGPEGVTLALR
jgi:transmembrane sensor